MTAGGSICRIHTVTGRRAVISARRSAGYSLLRGYVRGCRFRMRHHMRRRSCGHTSGFWVVIGVSL